MIFYMFSSCISFAVGYILDLIWGDPNTKLHPICLIGALIARVERLLLNGIKAEGEERKRIERRRGIVLVVIVVLVSVLIPTAILVLCYWAHIVLGIVVESIMCWLLLATKSLKTESMKVYDALANEGLDAGRYAVSMIVGRDTQALSETGVVKAVVETIAENTSDGVIAPLIYIAIGGAPLGFLYKAVNTMDSMVGYKNDKYMYFGTAAAVLDDVVNFIPARISARAMIVASALMGLNGEGARKIYKRDRFNHASPNSAQTESVMAGALDVELAGDAYYFGKLHKKKTIGDDIRPIDRKDIIRANTLMQYTSLLTTVILLGIKVLIVFYLIGGFSYA